MMWGIDTMDGLIALLGAQSPAVVIGCVVLGVVFPKIVEIIFRSKQSKVSREQKSIKRLTELTDDLYARVEKLESDLDFWKTKYFQLQKDFDQLEVNQKIQEAGLDNRPG